MRADPPGERGAALMLAVVALALLGAMVAGTFLAAWLEERAAAGGRDAITAFEGAESAAARAVAAWSPSLNRLGVGADSILPTSAAGREQAVTISRLSPSLFMVRAEGWRQDQAGNRLARRMVAVFVRLAPPLVDRGSALTLLGPAELARADVVDGSDQAPAGWFGICAPPDAVPPIRSPLPAISVDSGPPAPVVADTLLTPASFTIFGRTTFDELAATATHEVSGVLAPLGPSASGGRCSIGDPANWGEPARGAGTVSECFDFLPVVHAPGSVALTGGRGQGILLVRGDLDLSGGVEFVGVAVVLGRVTTSGTGGQVTGTLLVAGASGPSRLGDGVAIRYSSCSVDRALQANGLPQRLSSRPWAQLY